MKYFALLFFINLALLQEEEPQYLEMEEEDELMADFAGLPALDGSHSEMTDEFAVLP